MAEPNRESPIRENQIRQLEDAFERGVTTAEEIHRAVTDVPFETLGRLGVLEPEQNAVKRIHDETVTAIYDAVREVGRAVARLGRELGDEPEAEPDDRP